MWRVVKLNNFNELYTRSTFNTYVCNEFNVLKRTSNSIYYELVSKKKTLLSLMKTELENKKIRLNVLETNKLKLVSNINNLKKKVVINKSSDKELVRYRKYKKKYYYLCNNINKLKQNITKLEKNISDGNVRLSFGGKKTFKAQYNLKANNYKNLTKWKNDYKKKRDKNIFYLGSKDESCGNQLVQIDYNEKKDLFSIKIRKEKDYSSNDRYLIIDNINFKYMRNELIEIINGIKTKTNLLPLSYRIYRIKNKWYLQVIITTIVEQYETRKEYGVIGLDFNSGFISMSETNEHGNLVGMKHYQLHHHGCGSKAETEILDVISQIVTYAKTVGKDISIEDLKFNITKSKSIKTNNKYSKKYNEMIHTLDYSRYIFRLENKCYKLKVSLNKVNPKNTSKIGYEKYSKERKLTIHQAASFVIARRYQGFID
jgi:IS605 OrfB family transposase